MGATRPPYSQDVREKAPEALQRTLEEEDDPSRRRPRRPSASTPSHSVRRTNTLRGGHTGMTTRSATRYMPTILYLFLSYLSWSNPI